MNLFFVTLGDCIIPSIILQYNSETACFVKVIGFYLKLTFGTYCRVRRILWGNIQKI